MYFISSEKPFIIRSVLSGLYNSFKVVPVCLFLPNNSIGPIRRNRDSFPQSHARLNEIHHTFLLGNRLVVGRSQILREGGCRTSWKLNSINFSTITSDYFLVHYGENSPHNVPVAFR